MNDHDELGALLTASAPPTAAISDLTALSAALAREVVQADRGVQGRIRGLRRRHKVATAVTAAAMVLVPTGAFAAQHFLAQTGTFGNPAQHGPLEDDSEIINLCAKDFANYVATLAPTDLHAPPGHSWAGYAAGVAHGYAKDGQCAGTSQGLVQEDGLRLDLVTRATSDWGCELLWADEDGRNADKAKARATMEALNTEAVRLAPDSGAGYPPDTFLANSKLPEWVGCPR
ncbi:MAG: hypothetical protein ABIQ13_11805 [Pedococcus sp.]